MRNHKRTSEIVLDIRGALDAAGIGDHLQIEACSVVVGTDPLGHSVIVDGHLTLDEARDLLTLLYRGSEPELPRDADYLLFRLAGRLGGLDAVGDLQIEARTVSAGGEGVSGTWILIGGRMSAECAANLAAAVVS